MEKMNINADMLIDKNNGPERTFFKGFVTHNLGLNNLVMQRSEVQQGGQKKIKGY